MKLGLVATGRRNIRNGSDYDQYFDLGKLQGTNPMLMAEGDNYDTLRKIDEMARRYASQTKKIAAKLKGSSMQQSLKNLWQFLYDHVQYKQDSSDREELRQPLRMWKDRTTGVDCDCFSIFIKSVLTHWGYSNASRMAAYKDDFQHVYVVIPKDGAQSSLEKRSGYYVVDPVVNQFDYEVPFSKKYDRFMSLSSVNGLGHPDQACNPKSRKNVYPTDVFRVRYIEENGMVVTEKFLQRNAVPYTHERLSDGAERYNVLTKSGQSLSIMPVIGPTEASEILTKINAAPVVQPETKTAFATMPKMQKWGWAAIGALVVYGLAKSFAAKKASSSLSGPPAAPVTTPVKRKPAKKLRTIHI
jgi:hypothetical protein